MDNIDAEKTWPQCMCCALITSGVLISGEKNRGGPEQMKTASQRNKVDFQAEGL